MEERWLEKEEEEEGEEEEEEESHGTIIETRIRHVRYKFSTNLYSLILSTLILFFQIQLTFSCFLAFTFTCINGVSVPSSIHYFGLNVKDPYGLFLTVVFGFIYLFWPQASLTFRMVSFWSYCESQCVQSGTTGLFLSLSLSLSCFIVILSLVKV